MDIQSPRDLLVTVTVPDSQLFFPDEQLRVGDQVPSQFDNDIELEPVRFIEDQKDSELVLLEL